MGIEQYCELSEAFTRSAIVSARAARLRGIDPWWPYHVVSLFGVVADRVTWGVWVSKKGLPSAEVFVAHVLGQLAPRALIGLRSAAAMHGLLEAPETLDFVVPRGTWKNRAPFPFAHRRFDVTCMAAGDQVVTAALEPGVSLRTTSSPRTLIDLVRFRSRVGLPVAALALRRFIDLGGDLQSLHDLADRSRARTGLVKVERLARALPSPPPVTDCRPLAFPPGHPEPTPPFFSMR